MENKIYDGSKLISIFLDWRQTLITIRNGDGSLKPTNTGVIVPFENYNVRFFSELKFHTSWDWLMPVLVKITELAHENPKIKGYLENGTYLLWHTGDIHVGCNNIMGAFEEVVSFIEWYNKEVEIWHT